MPSVAFGRWTTAAKAALDEIEAAHRALGGSGPGRRYATVHVNHAYAVLVSSQFQGFCRDLHSEAVDFLSVSIAPARVGAAVRGPMVQGRKLDQGNPNPGNLGSDFGRLGMDFWRDVKAFDKRNARRLVHLDALNVWRNAIAHQDWTKVGPGLRLQQVRTWRSACEALAISFDAAVRDHLHGLVGRAPW